MYTATTSTKICRSCGTAKPVGDFYMRHKRRKDGSTASYPQTSCKVCHRAEVTANRAVKVDQYREYDKNRWYKDKTRRRYGEWLDLSSPDKAAPRKKVLPRPNEKRKCTKCNETKLTSDFFREYSCGDGYRRQCKICIYKNRADAIEQNRYDKAVAKTEAMIREADKCRISK